MIVREGAVWNGEMLAETVILSVLTKNPAVTDLLCNWVDSSRVHSE